MNICPSFSARPESRLWLRLGLILLAKCVALSILWYAFFSPAHRVIPDARLMERHLTGGSL